MRFSLRFTEPVTSTGEFHAFDPLGLFAGVMDLLAAYRRRARAPFYVCVSCPGRLPGRVTVSGPVPWDTPPEELDGMAAGWFAAAVVVPGSDC